MNYLQTMTHWFHHLELKRKLSLIASIIGIFILTIVLSWWVFSPDYAVLFNQLDEQDANKVMSQLEQDNISYQLRHDGKDILIDKNLVAKTRLKIMGSGMSLSGNVGFELFDKSDFGMTDFSQKINYQRALQGELERTISSIDEIRQARVHLVIPEKHLFDNEENKPKASVTLQLKHALTSKQIYGIQQLVAASVAHLNLTNVIIVDQNGTTLSPKEHDADANHLTAQKTIEHYLADKVMQILQKIFNKDQVMVKINVAINYDEVQRELVKPQAQGRVTHEKEITHSTGDKKGKTPGNHDLTKEKTYEFGHEKELFKRANGTIERLSVSIVLPQNTDAKTISQIQRLIKSTVGFDEKRGDSISVEALISPPQNTQAHVPPVPVAQQLSEQNHHLVWKQWIVESKQQLLFALLLLLVMGSSSVILLKYRRQKRRQQLLIELTQWLDHHE